MSQLKLGVGLSYFRLIIGFLVSIICTPIILRILGAEEYGLYNLVASVVTFLEIMNLGLGTAFIRYYTKFSVKNEQDEIARLNGMFLIIFLIIGIFVLFTGTFMLLNIKSLLGNQVTDSEIEIAKILMGFMLFNLAVSFPMSVFSSNIVAKERFLFQNIVQLISSVVKPVITLFVLFEGYRSVGMVMGTTIIGVLVYMVEIHYSITKLKVRFIFKNFNFKLLREIGGFSFYVFLGLVVDQINWNIDKFLLGRFKGTANVAIYAVGANLVTYYILVSQMLSNVFIPRVNRLVAAENDNQKLTELMTKVGRIQFMILGLILLGFTFFGEYFISIWAGKDYTNAYYVAVLLMFSLTISSMQRVGVAIQQAKNMHKFRSIIYIIIAFGNLCISIPLCIRYGEVGCAIGTTIAALVGNVAIMNWYYHQKVKLNMRYFWRQIGKLIPSLFVPVGFGITISWIFSIQNITQFVGYGVIFIILYGISIWFFGLNHNEKNYLIQPFQTIRARVRLKH
jgi:O-antigen/teichoic acid export membrane protein